MSIIVLNTIQQIFAMEKTCGHTDTKKYKEYKNAEMHMNDMTLEHLDDRCCSYHNWKVVKHEIDLTYDD